MRFGIIGGGNISGTHAKAIVAAGGEVAGVWGRNRERAARLASEHHATFYDDVDRLLRHKPLDAVVVGTPSGAHADHACRAAQRQLHVLVEKPLEISTLRADALIAECDRAGVSLGVIFQDRTAPELRWLKQLIDAGGLGQPILASAALRWWRPPEYYSASSWRGTWALDGGGVVMNQGVHTIDLLLWLIGDVSSVAATTRTAVHAIEVEDTAVARLEFVRGTIATFEASTATFPGAPRRIEISGTNGTIVVTGDQVVSADLRTAAPPLPPREQANANPSQSSPVVSDVRGHQRVIADFITAVRDHRPPLCDGRDGRRSVALVEAIYRSAKTGQTIVPNGG